MVNVSVTCPNCKKKSVLQMTEQQCRELNKGEKHIQDILTDFSPEDRETLISGICPKCWDEIFADEEGIA